MTAPMTAPTPMESKGTVEMFIQKQFFNPGLEMVNGRVNKVLASSELIGVIFAGDIIESINGKPIKTTQELIKAIQSGIPGKCTIEYRRAQNCVFQVKPLTSMRPGFDLFEVHLEYKENTMCTGILMHHDTLNQVVVAMVETGSMASKAVKAGDTLKKVNDKDVHDKEEARQMISNSIAQTKKIVLTLERPSPSSYPPPPPPPPSAAANNVAITVKTNDSDYTPTTYGAIPMTPALPLLGEQKSITGTSPAALKPNLKIDVPLPDDVLKILEQNKDFFRVKCTLPPCLKKETAAPSTSHVDLPAAALGPEEAIPCDPSPKVLKKTPKRVGS